jgi:hypothetical protein
MITPSGKAPKLLVKEGKSQEGELCSVPRYVLV